MVPTPARLLLKVSDVKADFHDDIGVLPEFRVGSGSQHADELSHHPWLSSWLMACGLKTVPYSCPSFGE